MTRVLLFLAAVSLGWAADLIPAARLSINGYRPGIGVGVRGGIKQYMVGGVNERPVAVDLTNGQPSTGRKLCRHSELVTASGTSGSASLTVNDGTLVIVGNYITVAGETRDVTAVSGNTVTVNSPMSSTFTDQTVTFNNTAIINGGIEELPIDSTLYIPAGLYRLPGAFGLVTGMDRRTVRGAGSFAESKTTHTLSTGLKTFTVSSGLPYEPGIGIQIERRELAQTTPPRWWLYPIYMRGRVVSYVGTQLTVNITFVASDGEFSAGMTYSDWKCSLTMFLYSGAGNCAIINSSSNCDTTVPYHPISGSPTRGMNQITVASGGGAAFTVGNLARLSLRNSDTVAQLNAGQLLTVSPHGDDRVRSQEVEITNISGDVLTIDPPLYFDLPLSLDPHIIPHTGGVPLRLAGMENFATRGFDAAPGGGDSTSTGSLIGFSGCIDCWYYDVEAIGNPHRMSHAAQSTYCEFRNCWIGWRNNPPGPNGAGILISRISGLLVYGSIIEEVQKGIQSNEGANGCAYLLNRATGGWSVCHGSQTSFNLMEGNVTDEFSSDGYHGPSDHDTFFRNYLHYGQNNTDPASYVEIRLCRFVRNPNIALNVIGTPANHVKGLITLGLPNMANPSYTGEVTPSLGIHWPELETGYWGDITTRVSDNEAYVTMTADAGLLAADLTGNQLATIRWIKTTGSSYPSGSGAMDGARVNMTVIGQVGSVWRIQGINGTAGDALPEVGKQIRIWPGSVYGFQQLDHDVALSAIREGNRLAFFDGSSTVESITSGAVVPDSYAFPDGPPDDWPSGLAWPPVNPDSPTYAVSIIPAGIRVTNGNGSLQYPTGAVGGGSVPYSGSAKPRAFRRWR